MGEKMVDAVNAISEVNNVFINAFEVNNTRDAEYFKTIEKAYKDFEDSRKAEEKLVKEINNREKPFSEKADRFIDAMVEKYKEYSDLRWTFVFMMFIIFVISTLGASFPIFPRTGEESMFVVTYVLFTISFIVCMAIDGDVYFKAGKRWPAPKAPKRTKEEKRIYKNHYKYIWKDYVKWAYFTECYTSDMLRRDLIKENERHIQTIEDYNRLVEKYNKIVNILTPEQVMQFKQSTMETE